MRRWTSRSRTSAVAAATATMVALALVGTGPAQARASDHGRAGTVYTLDDSTHGNPEGVASDGRSFYVGATGDGTIYRGTLGDPTVHTFIPGAPGRAAIGLEISRHLLYVAGGPTGKIFVYDLRRPTRAPLIFDTGAGGFLNDLVVTGRGDVYVTDSVRPTLWHIPARLTRSGGAVQAIPVAPEIAYTPGAFNLNGIVAQRGGRELVVVNSADGALYRIVLKRPGTVRTIRKLAAPALTGGDGMIIDRGDLIVVRGNPAGLTVLDLRRTRARVEKVITSPTLRGPSTLARSGERYLVVNADFATSTQPFTVASLPARASR